MSAHCYACNHGTGRIPGEMPVRDPHGVCRICGVLACGGHGRRDANVRRFECVVCVPSLLVASALHQRALEQTPPPVRPAAEDVLFDSVGEFLARWPAFEESLLPRINDVKREAPHRFTTQLSEPLWFGLPEQAQDLLAAAVAIAIDLELAPQDVPAVLAHLIGLWQ